MYKLKSIFSVFGDLLELFPSESNASSFEKQKEKTSCGIGVPRQTQWKLRWSVEDDGNGAAAVFRFIFQLSMLILYIFCIDFQ